MLGDAEEQLGKLSVIFQYNMRRPAMVYLSVFCAAVVTYLCIEDFLMLEFSVENSTIR